MTTSKPVDGRTLRYQHRRPELLAVATEYVLEHGIADLSLRPVAQALGITHATLLRHFSSKDEFLSQVGNKVLTDFLSRMETDPEISQATSTPQLLRAVWRVLCEPTEQRQFLLLFELTGRAAREPESAWPQWRSAVQDWLSPIRDRLALDGWSAEEASALATLLLAQVRGLQLDLLVSGDRERADRAIEFMVELVSRSE